MTKQMLIDSNDDNETRIAIIEENKLVDFETEKINNDRTKGNIYLAKIIRVEPSLQAAFVDYGAQKHGFLAYNEIHPDYFKIPTSDKKKLLEQELEASKNIPIEDENEDDFSEESFDSNSTVSENYYDKSKKGFLNKFFDFFNYKPLEEDFNQPTKVKKRRSNKTFNKGKPIIFHRKYSIQEVIKSNQVILIQVVKEERGNKGAAVTTRLSLAGKYCVLMPNTNKGGGISRKIVDLKLRKKIKDTVNKLNIKKGMGVIIRTAGQNMGIKEIKRDYNSLIKLWSNITLRTVKSNAPCLIHEEDNIIKRSLRDYFDTSFDGVLINNRNTFQKSKEIVKQFMPSSVKLLKLYKDDQSLFSNFGLEKQLIDLNNPLVYLKSGGYLVINQTEALVAIDINSGKSTKQRNIEDTAFRTNFEAAEEISKQIKIRDLAGLIVIDFIDMLDRSNNIKVERRIRDLIKNDRARVQCGRISNFGLMELSRQRLKVTTDTTGTIKCKFCNGYGATISQDFLVNQLLRVYFELKSKLKKEDIYILTNKDLSESLKKKINSTKKSKKFPPKINFIINTDFREFEYLVCSEKEVLVKNCHDQSQIENFESFLKIKESKTNKIPKIDQNSEVTKIDQNSEVTKNHQINEEKEKTLPKRVSYRAKADEFSNTKKAPKKISKKAKVNININDKRKKINIYPNDKKVEKKQGWWSQ